ncbi:MAG: PEGA domain-containing protein [bacterium]|nr:PEGA domain-containing protein [bacterium]
MFKVTAIRRTAVLVLVFFAWFCLAPQYQSAQTAQTVQTGEKPGDKLEQGKQKFEIGDYENSILLLGEYAAESGNPREKRAEAYYFLAKNYYAVDPARVKEMLLKAFDTDGFFTIAEKDGYFKKILEEARLEFIENIPADRYLEQAEAAFEQGKYNQAQYLYRVVLLKLPGKTFEKQIEKCKRTQSQKQEALELYRGKKYKEAYIALKVLTRSSPRDPSIKTIINRIETENIRPMIEAGDKHVAQKDYEEALPFYKEVLTLIPGDPEVQEKLTACLRKMEQETVESKTIAKERQKKRKKKKFPILPILLGVAAAVAIYFLVLKKKKEVPTTGTINVQSSPTGAAIQLDGQPSGKVTNAVLTNVSAGSHTIKLVKEGYQDYEVSVTVEAGKESLLFATLTASPTPDFVTNTDTVVVPEGGTNTFQVRLSERPASEVTASVSWVSGDTDISITSGASLTFTTSNWNTYQAVTLSAAEDDDTDNGQATFRVSADGIADKDVIAMEQDLGSAGELTVSPADNFTSSGSEGGTFSPSSKTYILQNVGSGSIQWTASNSEEWLTLSNTAGTLGASSTTTVVVSINGNADALSEGTYSDTVLFINTTNGSGTTTRTVTLQVSAGDQPPTVSIQSPADADTVSGTVSIQVNAADDSGVDKVEIYIDDSLIATLTAAPYTYEWDSTAVADGSHTIKATAFDTASQTADAEVTVTVGNGGT